MLRQTIASDQWPASLCCASRAAAFQKPARILPTQTRMDAMTVDRETIEQITKLMTGNGTTHDLG